MVFRSTILAAGLLLGSAQALDTKGMLAAPRRSTGSLSPKGDRALFSSTSYDWTTGKSKSGWYFLDVESGETTEAPFDSSVSEVVWIGETEDSILYLNSSNDAIPGGVTLYTADLSGEFNPKLVASLNAPFEGLKAAKAADGSINFVAHTLAHANGSAYNPELVTAPKSTGQLYDAGFVRHWNYYITEERYSVFGGVLSKGNGSYSFNGETKNLLSGMNYTVTRPESPYRGSSTNPGDYDISPDGKKVAFLTKSPDLPKANYTASYIYVVPHDGSEVAVAVNGPGSTAPKEAKGASSYPVWSHDSSKLAFGQQDGIDYESDRFKLYVADIDEAFNAKVVPIASDWDSTPSAVKWSPDDADLWVVSELHAMSRLWLVPSDAAADFKPVNFTGADTTVSDFDIHPDGSAFVSAGASWTSRMFYKQRPEEDKKVIFTANEVDPELSGLSPSQSSDFWVENEDGDMIQTFLYYPTDFDSSKKYPLMFIIHGGPQVAMGSSWSTRWNLQLWAEQGFVVAVTQFTGTPSYSQAFTDKIQANWGGTPYRDLVTTFNYMKENISYIDTDRAIGGGASFGCYMTNWIQGQPLGREFKALICHDGKVNQVASYATDEIFFIQRDNNGTVWDNRDRYEKWDPLIHAANFSTPELIIHNDLDYRVLISEGLQMFNILQARGIPSRFLHFPDEGHWVINRDNSLLWHKTIFDWIRYYAGIDEELSDEGVIKQ